MHVFIIVAIVLIASFLYAVFRGQGNKNEKFRLTEEFKKIIDILEYSNDSVFITGKAGTGKSTLIKYFIRNTRKKHVILAPTGIAALNVGGQTIHSFFKFPPTIINASSIEPDYVRADLFKKLEMVIIDEISMARADLIQGVDVALRKNRNRLDEPFGGVQMVLIGDLFQLPPVLKDNDKRTIAERFNGAYFFDANTFENFNYRFEELTEIFRQSEGQAEFKKMLNNIRVNSTRFEDMALLNSRHTTHVGKNEDSVFLTSRKDIARNINSEKLQKLKGRCFLYIGDLRGEYAKLTDEQDLNNLENKLPAPYELKLKENAQVMLLKNDANERWVNGTVGRVKNLTEEEIEVEVDGKVHSIQKETWREIRYSLNKETNEIEEEVIAEFCQYPLQLSYAITIHKSQGKTFDKVTIDIGGGAFAHGQIYVAVSRCKTLEGIVLNSPIKDKDIIVDPRIIEFYKKKGKAPVGPTLVLQPLEEITQIISTAIQDNKSIRIAYENFAGELSERELSELKISDEFVDFGYEHEHLRAFCHLRNEERSFKIDQIRKAEIIN